MLFKPTETAFVGELANFIIGCSFTVPAAFIYQKHKTQKQAIVGMTLGTLIMIIVGGIMNAFVLLPTYAAVFHLPIEELIAMGTSVNASINSLTTFVLFATTPLNLIKGVVCSGIVFVIYKRVSPFLKIKNHWYLNASIGSRFVAFFAGTIPEIIPTNMAIKIDISIVVILIGTSLFKI